MRRTLTPKTRLDTLRKDAKRWLKALRAAAVAAIARLREAVSDDAVLTVEQRIVDAAKARTFSGGPSRFVSLRGPEPI